MKYIFVTGAGRCGTNLINGILDGHSRLNVFPGEVTNLLYHSFINNGFSLKFKNSDNVKFLINTFLREIKIDRKSQRKKRIIKILASKNNCSINVVLDMILSNLYSSKKTNVINIQNENISGLLENFKDSKIIHMIRNPYTQINSRYLFRHKNPINYSGNDFSESFKRNYISFKQASLFKKHKNVKIIKFENLIDYPEKTIKKIFKFLNLKVEKKNLKLTRQNKIFVSTLKGSNKKSFQIIKYSNDYSNLLPNDLYYCSKIKTAKPFYKIKNHPKIKNSYWLFLLRHIGLVGKNRKLPKNLILIIKLIIHSIYNYIADKHIKNEFDNFLKEANKL